MEKTRFEELNEIIKNDDEEFGHARSIMEEFRNKLQEYLGCPDNVIKLEYSYYKKEVYYFTFFIKFTKHNPVEFELGTNESRYLFYSENDIEYSLEDEDSIDDLKDSIFEYLRKSVHHLLKKT